MTAFIHTADLHLGMRVTRFDSERVKQIREARFRALDNLLRVAKEKAVDFVLIAGDLFDDHAVDQLTARRAFKILDDAPMPVFVLSGNHDPLLPGSVWDRPPWNDFSPRNVRLFRGREPVSVNSEVVLLPCPVFRKTSLVDPTQWIREIPQQADVIRIGVAHGSLRTRSDLPADDHLIPREASQACQLDYLALGHWHRQQLFEDADGAVRTAYSGTHEPMRFSGSSEAHTGWIPYSGDREEFRDAGNGEALYVRLSAPRAEPEIEPLDVGDLIWQEEKRELPSPDDLARLIRDIANRPRSRQRLLRLKLSGVLSAEAMLALDELREILEGSYLWGELDIAELHLQPSDDEIREIAGQGILRRIFEQLQDDTANSEAADQAVSERAMMLLYRLAKETQS